MLAKFVSFPKVYVKEFYDIGIMMALKDTKEKQRESRQVEIELRRPSPTLSCNSFSTNLTMYLCQS